MFNECTDYRNYGYNNSPIKGEWLSLGSHKKGTLLMGYPSGNGNNGEIKMNAYKESNKVTK